MNWQLLAELLRDMDIFIDWKERFFICEECGEPIYAEDYPFIEDCECPICEYGFPI